MCRYPMQINLEYMRDCQRGRGPMRFRKLERFAALRWTATRDLRHARQWLWVMDAIKRRKPS